MNEAIAPAPRLFTVAELAEIFGCDPQSVRRKIHAGDLPAIRWGVELRVSRQALEEYLLANPARGPSPLRNPGRRGKAVGRPRAARA